MQEERFQTIGKSQIRVDAFDKVTGRADVYKRQYLRSP